MIAKVVGYQGFQSYGDLPYPSLKPGRQTLDSNEVWQQTQREEDKQSFYNNCNYHFSNKTKSIDQTTQPIHFKNVETVKKGHGFNNTLFQQTGSSMVSDVKTGTEHWVSNYQSDITDPQCINKAQRPEWTFHRPPYQVPTKVGPSEYKKQYGNLGENPRDKIEEVSETNPRTFDILRLGTTQLSNHIPGYTGFIPSAITASKAVEHGLGENVRNDYLKTNLKENYHTKIPGYAGHIPRSVVNQREVTQTTFFGNVDEQIK